MKPPLSIHTRRGFALALIMIFLAMAAVMAVAFLASATRERGGVNLYSQGSRAQHLANIGVNRVMGLINTATKEGTASNPVSWASQPGMIRTWRGSSPHNVYKLYSWQNPIESNFDSTAPDQSPPADWRDLRATYTDLNVPLNGVYPILDPAAEGRVEGFRIDAGSPVVTGADHAAPMPVMWLYVLEDGQLAAAAPGGDGKQVTVPGAGAQNPIVGRIAFWTDDETSKVNTNTASEGAYWDWPKGGSRDEVQFAGNPPVKGEFSRIPGHPAMTSISAVFPELRTVDRWQGSYADELESIYGLTPRINWGGSQGGTYPISTFAFSYVPAPAYLSSSPLPAPITLDTERLYATADDYWFSPSRTPNPAMAQNLDSGQELQRRLFFLTSNSRAPETTVFETPRISLWPITWPWNSSYFRKRPGGFTGTVLDPDTSEIADNPWMTAEERLLAFCGSLKYGTDDEQRYFFQRQNPDSPTHDWQNIQRNQELATYLRDLTNTAIPGYGQSLAAKWGAANTDALVLNTFDFSRSMINQYTLGDSASGKLQYSYTGVAFRRADISGSKVDYREPNAYTASPLRATLGSGDEITSNGSFPTLEEVALVFYATKRREPIPPGTAAERPNPYLWQNLINPGPSHGGVPATDYPIGSQTEELRGVMLLDFIGLNPGVKGFAPVFWVKVSGPSFTVNGSSMNLPSGSGRVVQMDFTEYTNMTGSRTNYPLFDKSAIKAKTFSPTGSGSGVWTLTSNAITVDPNDIDFNFGGSEITVEIYAAYSDDLERDPTGDDAQLISSKTVDFGDWNKRLPTPIAPRWLENDGVTGRPTPMAPYTGETRDMRWASVEIAPHIQNIVNDILLDPRDRLHAPNSSYNAAYAYKGKKASADAFISTDFANRVLSISQRSNISNRVVFQGEANSSFDLFVSSVKERYEEAYSLITPYDTVVSMIADANGGDARVAASAEFRRSDQVLTGDPAEVFRASPSGNSTYYPRATARAQWHQYGTPGRLPSATGYRRVTQLGSVQVAERGVVDSGDTTGKLGSRAQKFQSLVGFDAGAKAELPMGDWTSQPGNHPDGGGIFRPDQDYQSMFVESGRVQVPYFQQYSGYDAGMAQYFSPNRQVASPLILGTLPTSQSTGWQTLAFSPNPVAGASHPGLADPPDHLYLDFFWMPVAEPYPMSDQLSTAGKINLNYAMMPFSYIERKTGLHAALKSTWIAATPESAAADYKSPHYMNLNHASTRTRHTMDVEETLLGFDEVFASGEIFRTASQICEMPLVPEGQTLAAARGPFWSDKRLTSANARQEPYNNLYSRLTTKSNTFTVHWKVQALQKVPGTPASAWNEQRDKVVAELRGQTLIERYVQADADNIPDYATDTEALPLSHFYSWRVVTDSQFQP